jgi:hypothetical protein
VTVLDNATLNRALMARQLLLDRHDLPAFDAIEHLVGLQAQEPHEPYFGLWSRLTAFQPKELVDLLESRRVVRTLLMRRTLHLVSAADCLALRPVHQQVLVSRMWSTLRPRLPGVDLAELAEAGRPLFEQQPRLLSEVGRAVADRWPGVTARDLGDALSSLVPLVQVPPRGVWGQKAPAHNLTIEAWLGRPLVDDPDAVDALILRYLRAFGPAASADLRAWSGLAGLREALQRVRPRLRTFRDARGRELLDVHDGPLPDPATPAPPRFLPAFDNVVLAFDDRSRVIDQAHRGLSVAGARFVLVDGRVAATWTTEPGVVRIAPLRPLTKAEVDAVVEEGERLVAWSDGDGRVEVGK